MSQSKPILPLFKPARWLLLLVLILCSACQSNLPKELATQQSDFHLDNVGKADVDMFADISMLQSMQYLRLLALKLYLRNPNQLLNEPFIPANAERKEAALKELAVDRLFSDEPKHRLSSLQGKRAAEAIHLAFNQQYSGDRVAAFITGLRDMLLDAYGGQQDFYLYHEFDAQKIYHLARNFEVAFWKLNHDKDLQNTPYLLSNATDSNTVINLSFERLYGKLIALHDQMAVVIANTTNRRIKNVIQRAASMVFLPI